MDEDIASIPVSGESRNPQASAALVRDEADQTIGPSSAVFQQGRRKVTKQQLEERQRQMATLLSNLPGMAYRCINNRDWTLSFASDGCRALTGYAPEDLVGSRRLSYADLILDDDRERVWDTVQRGLAEKKDFRMTYRIRAASGEEKWVLEQGRGIFSATGALEVLEGFIIDVTERIRVEEELRVKQAAIEQSASAIMITTAQGRIEYVNPAFERASGYQFAELAGQNPSILKSGRHEATFYQNLWETISSGCVWRGHFHNRRRDGTLYWELTTISPVTNAGGEIVRFIAVKDDVTERKLAEEKLNETNSYLQNLINYANAPIIVWDPEFRITRFNHAFEHLTGRTEEEVLGQTLDLLFPPELTASSMELIRQTQSGERWETVEIKIQHCNGPVRTVLWNSATLFKPDGRTAMATIAQGQDITGRKRTEEELKIAKDAAEAANRAKSDFLASMSHEIRTPMNGVIGMTELLLESGLDDNQRELAETVKSSGDHLLQIINDILDLSKIEAGKLELERIDFDMRGLLEDIVTMLAPRTKFKGIELVCTASPDVPARLCGDPVRLRQVLLNLAGNAVKFTARGSVNIRVSLISQSDSVAMLRFSIKDTGIGIPEHKQPPLFQKFTQAEASTARRYGGTGLGLAISKELVERMGGEIGVISGTGLGAEFWFTAMFGYATDPAQPAIAPAFESRPGCGRLLVVDDNLTNQLVAVGLLKNMGLEASVAGNGEEALKALAEGAYDLVLMDVDMPVMDGFEATRRIRDPLSAVRNHSIPVIAMTAHAMPGDRKCCIEAGMDDYITKPISPRALSETLMRWVGEKESTPDAI